MEFIKNDLVDKVIERTFKSFSQLIDTEDYVEPKYNNKISKYIFKLMQKKIKDIDVFYFLQLEKEGVKLGLFKRLRIYFSGLRPIWNIEQSKLQESIILARKLKKQKEKRKIKIQQKQEQCTVVNKIAESEAYK